ncbi:MAG TPA: hypothetical protein VIJ06_00875 [Methylovirgula sp.]
MHVSHHFKHFALQPKTSAQTRAVRKKSVDIEGAGRVESRFSEDEEQENLGQRRDPQGPAPEGGAISPAIVSGQRFSNVAAPSIHVASVPATSPLDAVLASLMNAAPGAGGSDAGKNHDAARESSLEDLLALMRAPAPKS